MGNKIVFTCLIGLCVCIVAACGRSAAPDQAPATAPSELASDAESANTNAAEAPDGADDAVADAERADAVLTIVAMGNSLTEGLGVDSELAYPAQLQKRLLDDGYDIRVINAGISGETSSGALSRLDWVLQNEQPDIVILETGANDGLRGIDLALTASNIETLVTKLKESDVTVVLAGMQIVQNMGREYVDEFRDIFPTVAERQNVILIPFFLDNVAAVRELNQPDEIHPTADGYTIVVENVYPHIIEAINTITQ